MDSLFDVHDPDGRRHAAAAAARIATDASVATAAGNADPAWKAVALDAVRRCAVRLREFTVDDVWRELNEATATTHDARALGAVMRSAAKAGLVEIGGWRESTRPEAHSRPVRAWRSKLCG